MIERVGKGTYGTVFKAKSKTNKKNYAIKKLENNDPKLQQEGFPVTALRCKKNEYYFRGDAIEAYEPSKYYRASRNCSFKTKQTKSVQRIHIFGPRIHGS